MSDETLYLRIRKLESGWGGRIRTLDSIATIHAFHTFVEKLSLDFLQKFKNGILKNNIYVNFYFASTYN